QCHHGVTDVVHVHVDAAERPAVDGEAGGAALDAAAHVGEQIDEADVTLQTHLGDAEDGDATAGDGRGGPEVAGGGGVGFDGIVVNAGRIAGVQPFPKDFDLQSLVPLFPAPPSPADCLKFGAIWVQQD